MKFLISTWVTLAFAVTAWSVAGALGHPIPLTLFVIGALLGNAMCFYGPAASWRVIAWFRTKRQGK